MDPDVERGCGGEKGEVSTANFVLPSDNSNALAFINSGLLSPAPVLYTDGLLNSFDVNS